MSKIGRFLEHGDPAQDWIAVVLYPTWAIEQENLRPYRCLLESDQLLRVYLDELEPAAEDDFAMGILELIVARPGDALAKAKRMMPRVRDSGRTEDSRQSMLQFIETVVFAQFPKKPRSEIEKMLQVNLRETRVYQEAVVEGIERVALRLLQMGKPVREIAEATGLTPAKIRVLKKKLAE